MDLRSLLAYLPLRRFREPPPLVTVLRLNGVIGGLGRARRGLNLASQATLIERAFKPSRLSAVALAVNSPGGSPVQSALLAARIRALAEEKEVPVIAFAEDVAASGGYWLACAADEIYAQDASIVGSIGVISAGFGFPDLLERIGVERRVHTSGTRKSMLDPFRAEQPEDVERLTAIQGEIHGGFKDYVRARRGARLKGEAEELFSGEFWTGRRALELGLIDGLGDLRQVLRSRFGEKLRIKAIEGPRRLRLPFGLAAGSAGLDLSGPTEGLAEGLAGGLVEALEERALWSRFGL